MITDGRREGGGKIEREREEARDGGPTTGQRWERKGGEWGAVPT